MSEVHVSTVAYQVIIKAGIGHFRGFDSPKVRTGIYLWGFFFAYKLTCAKHRSVC